MKAILLTQDILSLREPLTPMKPMIQLLLLPRRLGFYFLHLFRVLSSWLLSNRHLYSTSFCHHFRQHCQKREKKLVLLQYDFWKLWYIMHCDFQFADWDCPLANLQKKKKKSLLLCDLNRSDVITTKNQYIHSTREVWVSNNVLGIVHAKPCPRRNAFKGNKSTEKLWTTLSLFLHSHPY